jgi:HEAT repeat protein
MSDPAIGALLEQSRSTDPGRQVTAIQQLTDLRAYVSVPTLLEILKSPSAVVRCTAAGALGRLGVKDAARVGAALLDVLSDAEVIVRAEAVDALGILGYAPAAAPIRSVLLTDPEPLVRASAAETLGDLGDVRALAELELALSDADEAVRGYAANSIGLLGKPTLVPALQAHSMSEQSPRVRAEIHGALYRLGSARDLDALLQLADTADEELAVNILNILDDLARRSLQRTGSVDAGRIRASVTALAQRLPRLSSDADHVLRGLQG